MKCIICRSDDIKPKRLIEEIQRGTDIVQVEVQALACESCGERYYDRKTMRELQAMQKEVLNNTAKLSEVGKVLAYTRT